MLHREGLAGVLNQTVVWLERAALGALIDPTQGWEPVRRDAFEDYLVADADGLRRLVNRGGGYGFLEFTYLKHAANDRPGFVHGQISASTVPAHPQIRAQSSSGRCPYTEIHRSATASHWRWLSGRESTLQAS